MRVAEAGSGPLVLLLHGFPECWYSWRHQLRALAEAGFHAVAPNQRGYPGTHTPPAVTDYTMLHLVWPRSSQSVDRWLAMSSRISDAARSVLRVLSVIIRLLTRSASEAAAPSAFVAVKVNDCADWGHSGARIQ